MDLKLDLAYKVVSFLHSIPLANKSKDDFLNYVSKKNIQSNVSDLDLYIDSDSIYLFDILLKVNFLSSYSEFKRFLKFGSIKINGDQIFDKLYQLYVDKFYFLQFGKKKILKFILKKNIKTY